MLAGSRATAQVVQGVDDVDRDIGRTTGPCCKDRGRGHADQ
jgi:hypothetical protein